VVGLTEREQVRPAGRDKGLQSGVKSHDLNRIVEPPVETLARLNTEGIR
jgi:hypothetical protein